MPRDHRRRQQHQKAEPGAMEAKENVAPRGAPPQPPPRRPGGKRKALAELPTTGPNTSGGAALRASKPRTRSAARAEAEAEEAGKRVDDKDAARGVDVAQLMDPKRPDAGAAQAAVAPYTGDIDQYLRLLEVEPLRRPNADNFSKIQKDITPSMGAVLVDWLVEVADEFKLQEETLHLAVLYVDHVTTRAVIARDKLQLLGVTALLVAAKYEEIEASKTKVNKYCDISDDTYTKQQVVKMEADLLKSLNFVMGRSHRKNIPAGASAKKLESMCSYLAELSLLDYGCIRFLPSVAAAACLFVARFTIHPKTRPWSLILQHITGYKVSDLKDAILAIHNGQFGTPLPGLEAIRNKYKDRTFGCVSTMASPREIPASFLEDCN